MVTELRKLAELLKAKSAEVSESKTSKCAEVVKAAIGLETLRKKLGK